MDRQTILGIITLQVTAFTLGTEITGGLSDACRLALFWALVGVVIVTAINEHRLRTVRE